MWTTPPRGAKRELKILENAFLIPCQTENQRTEEVVGVGRAKFHVAQPKKKAQRDRNASLWSGLPRDC